MASLRADVLSEISASVGFLSLSYQAVCVLTQQSNGRRMPNSNILNPTSTFVYSGLNRSV